LPTGILAHRPIGPTRRWTPTINLNIDQVHIHVDQIALRRLEKKCIQEEAPACEAACPLHLDARAFVGCVAQGDWTAAWKHLRRSLPLPGILGRICDAPCKAACRRGEAGDPIEVARLEHACVSGTTPPSLKLPPLIRKDQRVAVWGSGLSSLTVVWDLARKGYAVTLFEPAPDLGQYLLAAHPEKLSPEIMASETAVFKRLEVTLVTDLSLSPKAFVAQEGGNFDLIYLGLDATGVRADAGEWVQENARVFAGGGAGHKPGSPVWQAAEGRWAATTMDRSLQKVSLTAGREKEGPYPSRLFTNLDGLAPRAALRPRDPQQGYRLDEATWEADRCIQCQCLECVKVCSYLAHHKGYPKKYAREIYNNASIVMGARQANGLINACSLCGLCEQVCPENFAMQDLCLDARRKMVTREKMPPSAHEFALQDMGFSQGPAFAMARPDPDLGTCTHLFFPGCQLCASAPQQVFDLFAYLRSKLTGGVGLMLDCCAAPARWAGREGAFRATLDALQEKWHTLGTPQVIVACATCLKHFREELPTLPVSSLWETLSSVGPPQVERLPAGLTRLAVHDPCTARFDTRTQQLVRKLTAGLGLMVEELPLGGRLTECCGFGGLMQNANPELATTVATRRAALSPLPYLATCAMCRDNLAAVGKPAVHLLELLFPAPDGVDPTLRPRPGWSERRENRAGLKARLKKEIWREAIPEMEVYEKIRLIIPPEMATRMEARRILVSDIQQVIHHGESSGQKFTHRDGRRFKAAHAPNTVTFWIEYETSEEAGEVAYLIHNAYAHRMSVEHANGK
jgi:Fe-S oxidoreductase